MYLLLLLYFQTDLPSTGKSLPTGAIKQNPTPTAAGAAGGAGMSDADHDLEERLDKLRRQ